MDAYCFNITPRFSDTDAYGIVHHSSYYKWFEEARFSFAKEAMNITSEDLDSHGIKIMVVESYCKYKHHVKYGEMLTVRITSFKCSIVPKISIAYELFSESKCKVCAQGYTVHVLVDKSNKVLMEYPELILKKIAELKHANRYPGVVLLPDEMQKGLI